MTKYWCREHPEDGYIEEDGYLYAYDFFECNKCIGVSVCGGPSHVFEPPKNKNKKFYKT